MSSSRNTRYLPNPYNDFNESEVGHLIVRDSGEDYNLHPNFIKSIDDFTKKALQVILDKYQNYRSGDMSVYTGLSGILCLLMKIESDREFIIDREDLRLNFLIPCLEASKYDNEVTFMCGKMGPLALGIIYYHRIQQYDNRDQLIQVILNTNNWKEKPDEILYGKSGFLYSLLYIRSQLQSTTFDQLIPKVVESIIESGEKYAKATKCKSPLMYEWYDTEYIGAAHGLAGILYMLLEAREFLSKEQLEKIKLSTDFVLNMQFKESGNFPAAYRESDEYLIHWCHGAPGVIHLMIKAYKIFENNPIYLNSSEKCGELIWKKGILKKGYGLCHGTAGNAYAFIALYQLTKNPLYLYRASKFAEFCLHYGTHGCRTPDKPYSLLEGLAGTIYFLNDIKCPMNAKFPAFSL